MIVKDTYYIKRSNNYVWTHTDFAQLPTDELIEIRPMLFADEGKTLWKCDEEIGNAVWLNGTNQSDYEEREIVVEEYEEQAEE